MRRVLFVDDEPNVLAGLQRMLRPMVHQWEMTFTDGGPAALLALAEKPFDVVVTDMRMPGMDGAQLLSEVRRLHPRTVRIVISGHSDLEMIMKLIGPAHQYLSKPCEADTIIDTVSRACALRDLLTNPNLELLVSQMQLLPSLPGLYFDLIKEIESPEANIKRVAQILSRDPGMTAKILQLVNSAYFGLWRRISSASEAVSLLGLDTTQALVLSLQIFSEFNSAGFPDPILNRIWTHSMMVGSLAQAIARAEKKGRWIADTAFTSGLLHETGCLVLAAKMPREYSQVLALTRTENLSLIAAEQEVLGAAHPEVGAYLLGLWGLPDPIVEAVAFHHSPGACSSTFNALTAVHVADFLDHAETEANCVPLDMAYLARLGVADRVPAWEELYKEMNRSTS